VLIVSQPPSPGTSQLGETDSHGETRETMTRLITHPDLPILRWYRDKPAPERAWLEKGPPGSDWEEPGAYAESESSMPMRVHSRMSDRVIISPYRTREDLNRLLDIAREKGLEAARREDERMGPSPVQLMAEWLETGIHRHAESVDVGDFQITADTSDERLETMAEIIDLEAKSVHPTDAIVVGRAFDVLEQLRDRCARASEV